MEKCFRWGEAGTIQPDVQTQALGKASEVLREEKLRQELALRGQLNWTQVDMGAAESLPSETR